VQAAAGADRARRPLRLAVVGHVESVEIVKVPRVPRPGEVLETAPPLELTAGAGAIAALQLAKLAGEVTFYTALSDDERGRTALRELVAGGVHVEAALREGAQRRAFVHVDERGERTITVFGRKLAPLGADPLPWDELAEADGVCFFCGDEPALRSARRARVLVATARWLPALRDARVRLDALVGSGRDPAERYVGLEPQPELLVTTNGAAGGYYAVEGGPRRRFRPDRAAGKAVDAYGCGDSFAAGLTFSLARGSPAREAVAFAARCGAACSTGEGLSGQLRLTAHSRG
jgi:ribokinase